MFVTVLGRMAGADPQDYAGESATMPESQYYASLREMQQNTASPQAREARSSPHELINREQMAVFFVRYFEAFGVDYETGANITTVPADSISDYARTQS